MTALAALWLADAIAAVFWLGACAADRNDGPTIFDAEAER